MRVLVIGAAGLLGSNLCFQWEEEGLDVVGSYHSHPISFPRKTSVSLDIANSMEVFRVIKNISPDVIVHCAALANVDACEQNPNEAMRINSEGTTYIAQAAENNRAMLVYISTDSVFDGYTGLYREEDKPDPRNVYAKSKLQGERAVQHCCSDFLIIRTALYGWNAQDKQSLSEWILDRLNLDEEIPAFSDIFFTPILVNDLADLLKRALQKEIRGTLHLGSRDVCSKLDFAKELCALFGGNEKLISPCNIRDIPLIAPRPSNLSLNTLKASQDLDCAMPSVQEGLRHWKSLWDNGYAERLRSCVADPTVSIV